MADSRSDDSMEATRVDTLENESGDDSSSSSKQRENENPRLKRLESMTNQDCKNSSVLRPSQLNGHIGNNSPKPVFLLNPSRLNPFGKKPPANEEKQNNLGIIETPNKAPQFLPLIQNGNKQESNANSTPSTSTTVTKSNDFVFGQNIHDRVVSDNKLEEAKSTPSTATNGTSDMLFSSVLKETDANSSGIPQGTKSLSESAREYEESRAVKRKYEEVEIKTGEEGETNVLQITCKLFTFEQGGSWQERGRGTLRLNDQEAKDCKESSHSRLVFRTSGNFRLVLNTKIWAEMTVQRASDKSIRLTAFDSNGEIKVFLLTGSPDDMKQLQKHLDIRVKKEMEKHKSPKICQRNESQESTTMTTTINPTSD